VYDKVKEKGVGCHGGGDWLKTGQGIALARVRLHLARVFSLSGR
jgi:hypothetical protein